MGERQVFHKGISSRCREKACLFQKDAISTFPVEASPKGRICTAIEPTRSSLDCPLNYSGRGIPQGEALLGHRPYELLNRLPTERFRSRQAIDPTRSSIVCPLNDSGRGIPQGEALHGHRPYKVLNRLPTERFRSRRAIDPTRS